MTLRQIQQLKDFLASRIIKNTNGCWTCGKGNGYARLTFNGKSYSAHRLSYVLYNGIPPTGRIIRHRCDTPSCIRPGHLLAGTHKENSNDMIQRARGGWNYDRKKTLFRKWLDENKITAQAFAKAVPGTSVSTINKWSAGLTSTIHNGSRFLIRLKYPNCPLAK